jgi:hypothetical protein
MKHVARCGRCGSDALRGGRCMDCRRVLGVFEGSRWWVLRGLGRMPASMQGKLLLALLVLGGICVYRVVVWLWAYVGG